jgi:hypothetical protein
MRLGRKKDATETEVEVVEAAAPAVGPFDVADIDPQAGEYLDLGSLLIHPHEGSETRLQLDETSGQILAVLLVGEEAMLEVRAFAASRNGDLWADVRREIAADTTQRGGTATEQQGTFGPELYCQVPVQLEDGSGGMQASRVIGHNGPRWFLRAALMGRPAVEPDAAAVWEETIRNIVVRRGDDPLPPGEALPLVLPEGAIPMGTEPTVDG